MSSLKPVVRIQNNLVKIVAGCFFTKIHVSKANLIHGARGQNLGHLKSAILFLSYADILPSLF